MVHLNRIYTRSGDDGSTGLGGGERVPKHHLRVEAYGTVEETSSAIGVVLADADAHASAEWLRAIQNDLFDVGSDLCRPGSSEEDGRLDASYTARLEGWIDGVNAGLEPLETFVLPGGTTSAANLHLARTICRRAERCVTALVGMEDEGAVNPEVVRYLNRLSDLLFVMARAANSGGADDVLWQPGSGKPS
ncbi:MAG: ATP:cob(I)alamin adenosyltransferase [Planctomycetes bacterium]|jgi:cob(I)alamin adenosyltransferase|nr:ATP:cob(I)alamin adenosyltransferase [Planctomycetota bacterium]HJM56951.1 cob(I)yrinic acid a,c-diamide adenosyltransferase [Planctomycetota bacterium]